MKINYLLLKVTFIGRNYNKIEITEHLINSVE